MHAQLSNAAHGSVKLFTSLFDTTSTPTIINGALSSFSLNGTDENNVPSQHSPQLKQID
jgi:hypothetical protein